MEIVTDISIQLCKDEILEPREASKFREEIKKAINTIHRLLRPMIAFSWVDVDKVNGEYVCVLSSEKQKKLHIGPNASQLEKAQIAMVEVHTIGPGIDNHVNDIKKTGNYLDAYILDCAGVAALGKVAKKAHEIVESRAREKNWGVGASLSPGSLQGWDMAQQKELCSFLELDRIGVDLNPSNTLIPLKSVSSLIGLGPGYSRKKVGSLCHLCSSKEHCWRRER